MNRQERKKLAEETVKIINEGCYLLPNNKIITIKNDLDNSLINTKLYRPDDFIGAQQHILGNKRYNTKVVVKNKSSLSAAKEATYNDEVKVCCLNFASAKNPGGGFLNGSLAQEESLASASGLYHSISKQTEMYQHNRTLKSALYSDYIIYSPQIIIFRDDNGTLLEKPYKVSFITAPAVNAGAVLENEKHNANKIIPCMQKRAKYVFFVAAENNCETLILGAWGCGVFKNNPKDIAEVFYELIFVDSDTKGLFKEIIFAVYDSSENKNVLNTFLERFAH